MSEVRKELERIARELEIDKAPKSSRSISAGNDNSAKNKSGDEYLSAPAGYSKEYAETFASLSPEWRKYLCVREQEIERGFDDLRHRIGAYQWLEDAYATRADELRGYGIKSAREWLDNMIRIDEMLSRKPADTVNMLAAAYHVGGGSMPFRAADGKSAQQISAALADKMVQKQVEEFAAAQDAEGRAKHPFFREVVRDMYDLLQKGLADNLDDAYEAAVWFNASTRDKLIAKRSQEALELKSKDALKSKEAAFAPKGKADFDTKDMSLREELEMRFAALNGEL